MNNIAHFPTGFKATVGKNKPWQIQQKVEKETKVTLHDKN